MADWTNLPNTAVGVGGLPSGATVTALRDNPIAIVEGAAGAPRITGAALAKTGDGLPTLTVAAADTFTLTDGLEVVVGNTSHQLTTDQVARTITVKDFTGSIRFSGSHSRFVVAAGTSTLSIFKNGVLVQSWTNTNSSDVNRVIDINVVPGDVIEWKHRINTTATGTGFSGPSESGSTNFVTRPVLEPRA